MATTILPFVVRPKASTMTRAIAGDATIIIFPGVRYEAAEIPAAEGRPTTSGGSSPRKRKSKALEAAQ